MKVSAFAVPAPAAALPWRDGMLDALTRAGELVGVSDARVREVPAPTHEYIDWAANPAIEAAALVQRAVDLAAAHDVRVQFPTIGFHLVWTADAARGATAGFGFARRAAQSGDDVRARRELDLLVAHVLPRFAVDLSDAIDEIRLVTQAR